MNEGEIIGTYGSNKTETTIYFYDGWYVCDGSVNVNRTYEELIDGVNIELLRDYDIFTAKDPINSLEELKEAVNS